ncbi:uncharacterized protein LOC132037592 [Lycium ferocissimum]|uniref:uncharacterized protein LOC132037592 n=1 Tax=Lycium ferocissimum TaxID=112874 RepID=UPI002814F2A4|nr:uncharacterized protein LOC132037592 [Lycium ferocissimum]
MGTFKYSDLESAAILWIVPFCGSMDNWLVIGKDVLGCASIANEPLNIASDARELIEGVAKRSTGFIAKLYDCGCVSGVETDIESCGTFNTSCATYKLLGESRENPLMCSFDGVTTLIVEQCIISLSGKLKDYDAVQVTFFIA